MEFENEARDLFKKVDLINYKDLNEKKVKLITIERLFKVAIFGDQDVGITTFLKTYTERKFTDERISNTTGVDIFTKDLRFNNERYRFKLWQIKDQKRYKILLPAYLEGVDIAIFMYDITDYLSLFHVDDWLRLIKRNINMQFPMIMIGCKSDLHYNRNVPLARAIAISKSRGFKEYLECSALIGENINEIFEAIIKTIMQQPQKIQKPKPLLTSML